MATTITYETLTDIADEAGIDHDDIRTDYSGRGMFGRRCVGFDLNHAADLISLGAAILTVGGTDLLDTLANPSIDSMGRSGVVAYWRGITCEDAPEESDPWDEYEDPDDDEDDDS